MKTRTIFSLVLLLLLVVAGVVGIQQYQSGRAPAERPYPLELKWIRHSVEYAAICTQTYRQAWASVKQQTAGLREDWVVILDVDETVLDNSGYQDSLYQRNIKFPEYWDDWVREEKCPPVPGAKAFLDSVRTLGKYAHIAYITNRNAPLEAATIRNLRKTGLWRDGDILLCQQSREDTKEIRRQEVVNATGRCSGLGKKRIIALIGDQLADVMTYPPNVAPEDYRPHLENLPEWGNKYFILPNPMYGYWARRYSR